MKNLLILMSTVIALYAYAGYFLAILNGKAKPHRTTRFVILLISALVTLSLFAQGNTVAIWLSGVFTVCSLIIFLLSIKYGYGGFSKNDILCFSVAIIGIGLWKFTNNPVIGLFSSITADFIGFVPTVIKSYKYPETETWQFFFLGACSSAFNMLATKRWYLTDYVYPLYIIIINSVVVVLILRGKLYKNKQ
ncbi:hypothetical protein GYA27_03445, partial [candidate division WWE3 bacterium]|nr:hypothetical protein [candidate division WWE3 bacterium]